MIFLQLCQIAFLAFEETGYLAGVFQILDIFCITTAVVFGQHTVVAENEQHDRGKIKNLAAEER